MSFQFQVFSVQLRGNIPGMQPPAPSPASVLSLAPALFLALALASAGCRTPDAPAAATPPPSPSNAPAIPLALEGVRGWQPPTGTWASVGNVTLDPSNPAAFVAREGSGVLLNSPAGRTVDLLSALLHADAEVHLEFNVPQGSNSGVYFQGRYEIQVFDSFGKTNVTHSDCGGIYERWADNHGFEGHAPRVNASRAPGEWQRLDVGFRAPRFDTAGNKVQNARFVSVRLNGTLIHRHVEVTGPTRSAHYEDEKPLGPLMLQGDHGPVAYRNIRVSPVSL